VCDIAATKIRKLIPSGGVPILRPDLKKPVHLGTTELGEMFDPHDLNGDTYALHHMESYKGLGEPFCARAVELIKQLKP
jgi:hypothetical protein